MKTTRQLIPGKALLLFNEIGFVDIRLQLVADCALKVLCTWLRGTPEIILKDVTFA